MPDRASALTSVLRLPLAQWDFDDTGVDGEQPAARGLFSLDRPLMKVLVILLSFILTMGLCLIVIFPRLLKKKSPWWPRTAQGCCLAILVTATFAAVAVMLRNDLGLGLPEGSPWFSRWGGLAILGVVWLVCFLIALSMRSRRRA